MVYKYVIIIKQPNCRSTHQTSIYFLDNTHQTVYNPIRMKGDIQKKKEKKCTVPKFLFPSALLLLSENVSNFERLETQNKSLQKLFE